MDYRALIFDFDYTLADATPGIVDCCNTALRGLGYPEQTVEQVRRQVAKPLPDIFRDLTGVEDAALATAFTEAFELRSGQIMTANTVLLADSERVLRHLRAAGLRTAIVSNKRRERVAEALEHLGAAELFDLVLGGDDVSAPKPCPEGLCAAIETLGLARADCLYVGDSTIDAQTAVGAGVDFAGVTTGTTTDEEFAALPHVAILPSLGALLDRFARAVR